MKLSTRLVGSLIAVFLCHAVVTSAGAIPPNMVVLGPPSRRGSVGAVASESRECSAIGRDLLARGGNAADAIVGTTLCVGVVAMYHAGIGGGGFALVRDAQGNYEAVDFRETAPAAAHQDMFLHNTRGSVVGGLAVGVPGEVRGLEYIHRKYGTLSWKTVVQGSIHVARHGFREMTPVSKDLVRYMTDGKGKPAYDFLLHDPSFAQDFAPNGTLLGEGDMMTRKRYASVLEKIAEQGADAFYTGDLAEAIIKQIQETNGTMTLEDLRNYAVVSRPVRSTRFRDLDLYTVGAPASGVVGLSMLKTMEQYDANADADDGPGLAAHRFTEAMRFAYGARVDLADPAFVDAKGRRENNVTALERRLLDDVHAQHVRRRISDRRTQPVRAYDPGAVYAPDGHGTSHVVAADGSGVAVSLTSTVNLIFGAQLMEPTSGIVLNNEMNDFSIPNVPNAFGFQPSAANYIRPGKRPLSSITPVIAAYPNGTLRAVVGAAGGSRIISSTAAVLWHLVDHGMTIADALREPRLHDQLMPNTVLLEHGYDNHTAAALMEKGHRVTWVDGGLSAVQGITRLDDGTFDAAGEPRQDNSAGLVL
ncbi:gamma-glutamyltranspeptidase [Hirsutella rhossiliensis]|uniref:Glutathione hydrolase n=1 Tax=Hirsutella rhossiliensis TaxID=111463 RepID=A0A9P8MRT8_9HYPO|nr:gamma-glutamyltranspeptidase domain-containing protein [Hirsutella rhossiliensis]KAH0960743.1 gamma-glutamyltranspeptidase domain-containing protein [Hirsutella rhossiliensis]